VLEIRERVAFEVVEVQGLEPGSASEAMAALQAALARHAVLCLRMRRPLDDAEFDSVARLFGPIKDPVARAKGGSAFRYGERRQIIDSGLVLGAEIRAKLGDFSFGALDERRPGLFETYHSDDSFTAEPAIATVLHARELPPSGGGPTHFIDMRAAFQQLGGEAQSRLSPLRVRYAYNNQGAFPTRRSAHGPADLLEEVVHPLIRTHPSAGTRALYLDLDRAWSVEDLPLDEGRALLQRLQDHAEANAPHCQHDWSDHDVLVWDNASVQHKAGGNFELGEPRRFWRCMIAGGRPS